MIIAAWILGYVLIGVVISTTVAYFDRNERLDNFEVGWLGFFWPMAALLAIAWCASWPARWIRKRRS